MNVIAGSNVAVLPGVSFSKLPGYLRSSAYKDLSENIHKCIEKIKFDPLDSFITANEFVAISIFEPPEEASITFFKYGYVKGLDRFRKGAY